MDLNYRIHFAFSNTVKKKQKTTRFGESNVCVKKLKKLFR